MTSLLVRGAGGARGQIRLSILGGRAGSTPARPPARPRAARPGANPGDPLTYEFDCDGDGTFEIGPLASTTAPCTFTTLGYHPVGVRVTDGGGLTDTQTTQVLVFAYPARGQFVIGDLAPRAAGAQVTFWSGLWDGANPLSGGPAPSAFKGFDNDSAIPTCGQAWRSDPGNSSQPPASVPEYMAVIVSSRISRDPAAIGGDIVEIVIVRTDPSYAPNPGHRGTGTVVARLCG